MEMLSLIKKFENEELDKFIESDFAINNGSIFDLERELLFHAQKEAKYHRLSSAATREVAVLEAQLAAKSTSIVNDLATNFVKRNGGKVTASLIAEIRRTDLYADPEFIKLNNKLIEAKADSMLLNGLVSACVSRGYRLQELVKLADRAMFAGGTVKDNYADKYQTQDAKMDNAFSNLEVG